MTDQPKPCRSTQHCAVHGFCHRCTPSLDDATAHLVEAIDAAGIEYPTASRVYAQLAATVRDAARTAARQTTGQDDTEPRVTELKAEIARLHDEYRAVLRRADQVNNELMQEVQRYANGTERPVLWSVYNEMHSRALTAEAKLAATAPAVGQPASEYPRQDGDLTVLGPEIFASTDGQVISWRGLNYVPQVDAQPLAEARRDIHEALVVLPAPEADRVRGLIARLETAARAAVGQPAEAHDTDRAVCACSHPKERHNSACAHCPCIGYAATWPPLTPEDQAFETRAAANTVEDER